MSIYKVKVFDLDASGHYRASNVPSENKRPNRSFLAFQGSACNRGNARSSGRKRPLGGSGFAPVQRDSNGRIVRPSGEVKPMKSRMFLTRAENWRGASRFSSISRLLTISSRVVEQADELNHLVQDDFCQFLPRCLRKVVSLAGSRSPSERSLQCDPSRCLNDALVPLSRSHA
jgi:hypothetical protein